MREVQNMSSDQVCASSVHLVCICDVMHDQGMIELAWGKVCKTHIQRSKHDKHA